MSAFFAVIQQFFDFFLIGAGPALWLFGSKRRLSAALLGAPVLGLAFTLLIGTALVRLNLPVQQWAFYYLAFAILVSAGLSWLAWRRGRLALEAGEKPLLTAALTGATVALLLLSLPLLIGGEGFTTLRGNLYDDVNYMTGATYVDSVPVTTAASLAMPDLLEINPGFALVKDAIADDRISIFTLLAWAARTGGQEIVRFDYAFTLLLFLLAFFPALALALQAGLRPPEGVLAALAVCAGFWAQIVLDLRTMGQITGQPLCLAAAWLAVRTASIPNWKQAGGEFALLGTFGSAAALAYPEYIPLLGLGLAFFIGALWLRRTLPAAHPAGYAAAAALAVVLLLPDFSHTLGFIAKQVGSAASQGAAMRWERDWFIFMLPEKRLPDIFNFSYIEALFNPGLPGYWGLSYLSSIPLFSGGLFSFLIALMAALLGLYGLTLLILAFVRKNFNPARLCLAGFTTAALLQFMVLFFQDNSWAACKTLSYSYPFITLLLIASALGPGWPAAPVSGSARTHPAGRKRSTQHSPPATSTAMSRWRIFAARLAYGLGAVWLTSQLGFALYRIPEAPSGRTYFNPQVPQHRSGQSVPIDRELAKLQPAFNSIQGKRVWAALPNVWTFELLNLTYGPEMRFLPLFSAHHYATEALMASPQSFHSDLPDYLLLDKSLGTGSAEMLSLVAAETSQTILLRTDPGFWQKPFLFGITSPYRSPQPSPGSLLLGSSRALLWIYLPDGLEASLQGSFKPVVANSALQLKLINDGSKAAASIPIAGALSEVLLPLEAGLNQVSLSVGDGTASQQAAELEIAGLNFRFQTKTR